MKKTIFREEHEKEHLGELDFIFDPPKIKRLYQIKFDEEDENYDVWYIARIVDVFTRNPDAQIRYIYLSDRNSAI